METLTEYNQSATVLGICLHFHNGNEGITIKAKHDFLPLLNQHEQLTFSSNDEVRRFILKSFKPSKNELLMKMDVVHDLLHITFFQTHTLVQFVSFLEIVTEQKVSLSEWEVLGGKCLALDMF